MARHHGACRRPHAMHAHPLRLVRDQHPADGDCLCAPVGQSGSAVSPVDEPHTFFAILCGMQVGGAPKLPDPPSQFTAAGSRI